MQKSLRTFLASRTVTRLRESIQVKGPLPGLASAVRLMELAEEKRSDNDNDIVKAVLADPSLMQKVLRLANSSMYATFGGYVDSISRALAILGTETVAHLAFSQTLLDNLKPGTRGDDAVATMESASLAGHMARQFTKGAKGKDVETAVICALMHSMGRLLLEFYLPHEGNQLNARLRETTMTESEVAIQLLGLSLEELGLEAAREWRMPVSILAGLRTVAPTESDEPVNAADRLAAISTLAHRCAETVGHASEKVAHARLVALTAGYATMLGTSPEALLGDLAEAKVQATAERAVASAHHEMAEPTVARVASVNLLESLETGIADIRARLGSITPGEALSVATESLFTGLGLSRSFVFIRKGAGYSARMGVGDGAKALLPTLQFEDAAGRDLLSGAMSLDQIVYVQDTKAPAPGSSMPAWWARSLSEARSVILVPILVNQKPLGFIYGEWTKAGSTLNLSATELEPIEKLRKAILAAVLKPATTTSASRPVAPLPAPVSPVRAHVGVLDTGRAQPPSPHAVR